MNQQCRSHVCVCFWWLFADFGGWQSSCAAVSPRGRCLTGLMQQRQSSVAAFMYYHFLVKGDPAMGHAVLPSVTMLAQVP
ncbi:hypothetical protein COO60DRAFT_271749 [Scenedesmus sp. NREL 46B-D3]|nr:hypothetical protein COO60DRAFT_271749 [Scenedesmus sp. NREL 46B-D3]